LDLFKPRGASSPRNPTTDQQNNGQIVNPPRYAHLGGLSSANKASKNQMTLERPVGSKTSRKVI
jgi:hypothetical protein